jgi:hypothetical protein
MRMQSLFDPYNHFFSLDGALDRDVAGLDAEAAAAKLASVAEAVRKANDTGDPAGLPVKEGRKPVTWRLAPLTEVQHREVLRNTHGPDICSDAFRRALSDARDLLDLDGMPCRLEFEDRASGRVLTQRTVNLLHRMFGMDLIFEIGTRALEECTPRPR